MSVQLEWAATLPPDLQAQVAALVAASPEASTVLNNLYQFLTDDSAKRRKMSPIPDEIVTANVRYITDYSILINNIIPDEEVIFELPQVSFQSPVRKKMNLVFHLLIESNQEPKPVLAIVNTTTRIPEHSYVELSQAIKLCVLMPILGMSTVDSKKGVGSLCFWLDDKAVVDPFKNDPIICQVNIDSLKKHLIKAGKLPATIESQYANTNGDGIKPLHEAIIQFLKRQFQMCGINMVNYLPSSDLAKNKYNVNTDNGLALSHKANSLNDLVMVEAYKGARDGCILLLNENEFYPSYLIFGFKKPILIFELASIKHISYANITRLTFSIVLNVINEKRDNREDIIEFSMIDQRYFQYIDDFFKLRNIINNSYDVNLQEKPPKDDTSAGENGAAGATNGETNQTAANDDDSDEDDGNYQGGEEDDDVAEEYDSNAEPSDNENGDTLQQGVEEEVIEV